ncbi:MAG: DUF934 domain-containing protein [Herminiimonas sp.]|uniref:DUF934 domain-containing protein n=1 Tax=Herminiimonas sp. TaxID=1926289 RepID=UPI0027265379|nr:DUF934 domain-containing protein [Herminiimonas sp.]MDO9419916.1 DUF934 domain-containing protein [Herminiimonas sp.]
MLNIIKDKVVVGEDDWTLLRLKPTIVEGAEAQEGETPEAVVVPAGKVIVPLAVWQAQRSTLEERKDIGVWLASDERPEALKDDVTKLSMIAIDFPKFADGRGYSIAYNLRARYDYTGELRAVGDVLRDQLFYMQRVGFNSFAVRADRDVNDALKGLSDFSESYQQSWDKKTPLFRRVDRQAVAPK